MTTYLRGRIKTLNIRTIRCEIHSEPLTEEDKELHIRRYPTNAWSENPTRPTEHDYEYWVNHPISATFKLTIGGRSNNDMAAQVVATMYEKAYRCMDDDLILRVEGGNILREIEIVKPTPKCHFCKKPRFDEKRNKWIAICFDYCSERLRNKIEMQVFFRIPINYTRNYEGHLAYMCNNCSSMKKGSLFYGEPLTIPELERIMESEQQKDYSHASVHGVRVKPEHGMAVLLDGKIVKLA